MQRKMAEKVNGFGLGWLFAGVVGVVVVPGLAALI